LLRAAEAELGRRGSRERIGQHLRSAHRITVRLGATPLRDEIELLARHARIDLGDAPTEPQTARDGIGLTQRESEVVRLVAAGWSNQQIADALFITRKTASVHVSNIMAKFGASNRVEAAAVAHRLGLVGEVGSPP
jgi:DNA-binding NarL/FixJ family response regulator